MTHGSLFSGIGGFDLGFERAGFKTVWQVEIDPFCRKVLEKHFPNAERFSDIRECSGLCQPDIITGGFPCQPFSTASRGRRCGTNDTRWLWPEMRRIIQESKPAWVLGENVAGFNGPGLEQMVAEMEADGYEVGPPLGIPACAVGRDHRRSRFWILAYSNKSGESRGTFNAEAQMLSRARDDCARMGTKNGISVQLDRTRMQALGNAIVPQIAQFIAERIKAVIETE